MNEQFHYQIIRRRDLHSAGIEQIFIVFIAIFFYLKSFSHMNILPTIRKGRRMPATLQKRQHTK